MSEEEYRVCSNCVMDTTDPNITFDEEGRCDYCNHYYAEILPNWHPDDGSARKLQTIAARIRADGRARKYDCIIGLSGGMDSSYLTYVAKEIMGLRPLALSVVTGWETEVAFENLNRVTRTLGVDLETLVVDWQEMKDLQLSFMRAHVPYLDIPQDHAIFAGLYNYAVEHGFEYILTGANYSMEDSVKPPKAWTYVNDIRLLKDIHRRFGKQPLRRFPLCGMFKYKLYYRYIRGLRVIKPLNSVPYRRDDVLAFLQQRFGWQRYANKHYENIFTRFVEGYIWPRKFGYDKRKCYFSSLILTGQMTRDQALRALSEAPYDAESATQDKNLVLERLGLSENEFRDFMEGDNKTFRDYQNSERLLSLAIQAAKMVGMERRNFR